jgi:pyruvate kinase
MDAGMDVARLNFSHGTREEHQKTFTAVRSEAEKRNQAVAVLLDLQGPKIRVGTFDKGEVELKAGQNFVITTDTKAKGDQKHVSTSYENLPKDVKPGDRVLLDDGLLVLEVTKVGGNEVETLVISGGVLKNNKGINLPNVKLSTPALTPKDREDLAFGVRLGVDYIALSFVRAPEDVLEARRLATADDKSIPIIAKIEKPEALSRLDEIIVASDGIMIARGDLGVELGPEKVPLVQKRVIKMTNDRAKVCITATQMLESMIKNHRPTRAEASDIANAVLDGTDALMLSGETAVGDHPIEAVKTMDRIIREVEKSPDFRHSVEIPELDLPVSANAVALAACTAAQRMRLKTIALVSTSGGAARLISEYRPEARILALTSEESTYRRLALYWGVEAAILPPVASEGELFTRIESIIRERGMANSGEYVAITAGVPIGAGETTNMLKIHRMP